MTYGLTHKQNKTINRITFWPTGFVAFQKPVLLFTGKFKKHFIPARILVHPKAKQQ